MNPTEISRLGSVRDIAHFQEYLAALHLKIPCDSELVRGSESPLAQLIIRDGIKIGNRIAINPMEGWDGEPDGNPSEHTLGRCQRFGRTGAKLIWGGEAVAACPEGRDNPNQLLAASHPRAGLARLKAVLVAEHREVSGSDD